MRRFIILQIKAPTPILLLTPRSTGVDSSSQSTFPQLQPRALHKDSHDNCSEAQEGGPLKKQMYYFYLGCLGCNPLQSRPLLSLWQPVAFLKKYSMIFALCIIHHYELGGHLGFGGTIWIQITSGSVMGLLTKQSQKKKSRSRNEDQKLNQ